MISDHVAMTTSSASAVIDGHKKVTTPAKMPVTPREGDPPSVDEQWVGDRGRHGGDAVDERKRTPQEHEAPERDSRPHQRGEAEEHCGRTVDGEPLPATDVGPHHDVAPTVGAGSAARSSAAMRASAASMMAYSATFRK